MPSGRGGKRAGAGGQFKPDDEKKVRVLLTLSPEVALWLRSKRNSSGFANSLFLKTMREETENND